MKAFVVKAMRAIWVSKAFWAIRSLVLVGAVLMAGGAAAYMAGTMSKSAAGHSPEAGPAGREPAPVEKVKRDGLDAVVLPANTAAKMGLQTATARYPTRPIRLPPFQGVLALDNDRLSRVRCRFAGEVVEIRSSPLTTLPAGERGEKAPSFQVGDPVRKGDLLAVVWSKDLGEKKSELVDALSRLRLDRDNLARYMSLTEGVIALKQIREAEAAVRSSAIAAARAEATLRAWRLSENEIQALLADASKLSSPEARREWAKDRTWAQVEVRAPLDGVILEKNVAAGDMVDTTADLFKIGDLSHLTVWAHVYEEDLVLLQVLPRPIGWAVTLPSQPGTTFPGTLARVGAMIDPAQHTALVSGRVENPSGSLKAGQHVTVTVELPPPSGEIELPAAAVVEDGRESVVFVQPDPREPRFVRRPVSVLRRFREEIYVRAAKSRVQAGNRVVTTGALLLRDAMDQLPALAAQLGERGVSTPR